MTQTDPDRLRFIFSNIHEAVLVEDHNRQVRYANQAFTDLFAPGSRPSSWSEPTATKRPWPLPRCSSILRAGSAALGPSSMCVGLCRARSA